MTVVLIHLLTIDWVSFMYVYCFSGQTHTYGHCIFLCIKFYCIEYTIERINEKKTSQHDSTLNGQTVVVISHLIRAR